MTKVIKGGTVCTADRTWKTGILAIHFSELFAL